MRRVIVPTLAVFFVALAGISAISAEVFFTPGPACESKIIEGFNNAKKEAVAAVYSINNPRIVAAIEAAHKRGVKVRVLTDRVQAAGPSSRVVDLVKAGIPLRVHSKHKIEHNKFGVFDKTMAITGSFNWTKPASEVNSENCVVLPEANAVASYRKRFESLWNLNSEEKSKAALAKIRAKRAERALAGE